MDTDSSFLCFAALFLVACFLNYIKISLMFLRKQKSPSEAALHSTNTQEKNHAVQCNLLKQRADEYLLTVHTALSLTKMASILCIFNGIRSVAETTGLHLTFWHSGILSLVACYILILGLSEMCGRFLAKTHPEKATLAIFGPVMALHFLFLPLSYPLQLLLRWHRNRLRSKDSLIDIPPVAEDLIEENGTSHALKQSEMDMISSIIEFRDTIVREIMVPRVDMQCVPKETTLAEARAKIVEYRHSRLPIYADNIDNIIGYLFGRDILEYMDTDGWQTRTVEDCMHEIGFIPETKNISDLLKEFQQTETQFAIVVDEYGGTAGLVSIEDLLEEIVGEIRDELDQEQPLFTSEADNSFIVDAKMTISEIEEELDIALPEESDYDTVGGYFVTHMGRVPVKNDSFTEHGITLTVIEADDRKIHKIKLQRVEPEDTNNGKSKET